MQTFRVYRVYLLDGPVSDTRFMFLGKLEAPCAPDALGLAYLRYPYMPPGALCITKDRL